MKKHILIALSVFTLFSCKKESNVTHKGQVLFIEEPAHEITDNNPGTLQSSGKIANFDLLNSLISDVTKQAAYDNKEIEDINFTRIVLKDINISNSANTSLLSQYIDSSIISTQGRVLAKSYPSQQGNLDYTLTDFDLAYSENTSISTTPETSLIYGVNCTWCVVQYQFFFNDTIPFEQEYFLHGSFEYEVNYKEEKIK